MTVGPPLVQRAQTAARRRSANKPGGSYAVMAQRTEPHDSLEFFPTPCWATRALCEWLQQRWPIEFQLAWDPACGDGAMTRPLAEYFRHVHASDVHDYGGDQRVSDFLLTYNHPPHIQAQGTDWIITNPPFRLACDFALTALERARIGVALLVRTAFLESAGRYERLFSKHPPVVLQFVERVPMVKGRLDAKVSSATAYCWLVWFARDGNLATGTIDWIPPCRKRLERPGDYDSPGPPDYAAAAMC